VATFYNVLLGLGLFIAILFSVLVFVTGKGDAMSGGGGGVRTTFKGKASFDDIMSKWTLALGVAFMALMILIDIVSNSMK
jgi:preprotein translocase subunit SecG